MRHICSGFGLFSGATYPFRALAVFWRQPRLWSYIIVPILLNAILGILLYAGLFVYSGQAIQAAIASLTHWLDTLIANLPTWLGFLDYILLGLGLVLRFLVSLLLFIVTGFLLAQFGVLLGAPWYGQLSEQLEKIRTGYLYKAEVSIFRDLWRAILFELKKLILLVTVGLPLLALNVIPGLGTTLSTMGGITLTATLACLDFLDAPLERRRLSFRQKLGIVFRTLPASASFSLVCLALISVPLLNLVTIPLCVAAGTLFVCDRILPNIRVPQ
jgi:CysZ protein